MVNMQLECEIKLAFSIKLSNVQKIIEILDTLYTYYFFFNLKL